MDFENFLGCLTGNKILGGERHINTFTLFFINGSSLCFKIQKSGRIKQAQFSFYNSNGNKEGFFTMNIK